MSFQEMEIKAEIETVEDWIPFAEPWGEGIPGGSNGWEKCE